MLSLISDILGHPVYVVLRAIILPVWDVLRFRNTKLGPEFSAEILSNTFSETWNRSALPEWHHLDFDTHDADFC